MEEDAVVISLAGLNAARARDLQREYRRGYQDADRVYAIECTRAAILAWVCGALTCWAAQALIAALS